MISHVTRYLIKPITIFLFFFALMFLEKRVLAQTTTASICDSLSEDTPVLAGGRIKPYYVLAKESIKFLTGKSHYNDEEPVKTFCHMTMAQRTKTNLNIPIYIEHIETKKFLGIREKDTKLNALKLVEKKDLIRSEFLRLKENNSYKKDLSKLYSKIEFYEDISSGKALSLYVGKMVTKSADSIAESSGDKANDYKNLNHDLINAEWKNFASFHEISDDALASLIKETKSNFITDHSDHYLLELSYVKFHFQGIALTLVLIGIFLTVLLKKLRFGVVFAISAILVELIALVLRSLISGRAPITNMYETVMFSGFGALIIALILIYFRRDKIFLLAGLGYNMLCLFMMIFANGMLSSSISPLVPVLRDNFWLSTHVTTIILSYAALALSWMVANITLFKMRFKTLTSAEYRSHQDLIYTCIKVGIVLLAAGIILGGIWADYSWGRFWGWDPKETWSLIVLLFYMVLLHGKYSSWITTHRFIILAAAGFMTVMMAWFGVNYILASGLHSYGFSEGGALFLATFFTIQSIFIILCAKVSLKVKGE